MTVPSGDAQFNKARFAGLTLFEEATFCDGALFAWATFFDDASFNKARFFGDASFNKVGFSAPVSFARTGFGSGAISFEDPRQWGPPAPTFDWDDDLSRKPENVTPQSWPPIPVA